MTASVPLRVVLPVTASVPLRVVLPVTASVPPIVALPVTISVAKPTPPKVNIGRVMLPRLSTMYQ